MVNTQTLRTHQKGLTLIEVLVAALVLAVGLVGLAGLNLRSLQASHSAYFSSIASMIAIDVEERAWLDLGVTGSFDLQGIEDDSIAAWGAAAGLPDLDIQITEEASGNRWMDIDIEIRWSESRFVVAQGEEVFRFSTRVPTAVVTGP